MFPIKQKCDTMAAFLDNPNFSIWSSLGLFTNVQQAWCANGLSQKLSGLKHLIFKKAVVIFNFCLIGNIRHNFLVTRLIEDFHVYSDTRSTQSDMNEKKNSTSFCISNDCVEGKIGTYSENRQLCFFSRYTAAFS